MQTSPTQQPHMQNPHVQRPQRVSPRLPKQSSPLFRLPLELRQLVYAQLLPAGPISHPFASVGITSVSHKLPSSNLLNVQPQLTDEILHYYYTITTWKLIFSHAFNFFRIDPDLAHLARSAALKCLRQVEVVFFCDILLLRDYPSFGLDQFCAEIRRRADRACDVLSQARHLRSVTVSWIDTTLTGGWEQKATVLEPLRKLARDGQVRFRIGEVTGPEGLDRDGFVKAMEGVLGEGRRLDTGMDGTGEGPAELRMLAFDVRQERGRAANVKQSRRCGDCVGHAQLGTQAEAT